jgi:hypothetical protein
MGEESEVKYMSAKQKKEFLSMHRKTQMEMAVLTQKKYFPSSRNKPIKLKEAEA